MTIAQAPDRREALRPLRGAGGKCLQKFLGLGVVPGRLTAVGVVERVSRTDDDDAAELPRVPLDLPLPEPTTEGPKAVREDGGAEESHDSASELSRPVGVKAGVDKQGKRNFELLPELTRLLGRSVPDNVESCTQSLDLLPYAAQLRDLLAAEDSTEVTNEDEYGRPLGPELPQESRLAIEVLNLDVSEVSDPFHEGSPQFGGRLGPLEDVPVSEVC